LEKVEAVAKRAHAWLLSLHCYRVKHYNAASLILLRSTLPPGVSQSGDAFYPSGLGFLLMPTSYKGHTLFAGAVRGQISDHYLPTVLISWEIAGVRNTFTPSFNEHFPTFDEATDFALSVAKVWVDQHVAGED
jgi:hypothetical protein